MHACAYPSSLTSSFSPQKKFVSRLLVLSYSPALPHVDRQQLFMVTVGRTHVVGGRGPPVVVLQQDVQELQGLRVSARDEDEVKVMWNACLFPHLFPALHFSSTFSAKARGTPI